MMRMQVPEVVVRRKGLIGSVATLVVCGLIGIAIFVSSGSLQAKEQQTYTVQFSSQENQLFLSGTIAPIAEVPVLSPTKGGIQSQLVPFGSVVKKDQPLFVLRTTAAQSELQDSISSFLKSKQMLAKSQQDFETAKMLLSKGLESRDDYQEARDQYDLNQLSYLQAKSSLEKALGPAKMQELENIDISDFSKIKALLNEIDQLSEVTVNAPTSGTLLFSKETKNDDASDTTSVKEDDVLGFIANDNGFAIQLNVGEMQVNQVKAGLQATITSPAAPNVILKGSVTAVSAQATSDENSVSPTFAVTVVVPKVTPAQQQLIHIGMDVKVAIDLQKGNEIIVPVNAIVNENGQYFVNIKDPQSDNTTLLPVTLGNSTIEGVEVIKGLKPGDQILLPPPAES